MTEQVQDLSEGDAQSCTYRVSFNVLDPAQVILHRVGGQTEQLHSSFFELRCVRRDHAQLRCANWGEIAYNALKVKLIIISNDTGATNLEFNTVPQSSS
jgi:hypothetical protein